MIAFVMKRAFLTSGKKFPLPRDGHKTIPVFFMDGNCAERYDISYDILAQGVRAELMSLQMEATRTISGDGSSTEAT